MRYLDRTFVDDIDQRHYRPRKIMKKKMAVSVSGCPCLTNSLRPESIAAIPFEARKDTVLTVVQAILQANGVIPQARDAVIWRRVDFLDSERTFAAFQL